MDGSGPTYDILGFPVVADFIVHLPSFYLYRRIFINLRQLLSAKFWALLLNNWPTFVFIFNAGISLCYISSWLDGLNFLLPTQLMIRLGGGNSTTRPWGPKFRHELVFFLMAVCGLYLFILILAKFSLGSIRNCL